MPLVEHHGKLPGVHPSAFVAGDAVLIGAVELGKDVSIWFKTVLRADINTITVGDRTNIQDGCILHVTHEYPVEVGVDVTIGHRAVIHGCSVLEGSLVGMGALVLDNARVGPSAIVAAGAVVLENFVVPEGTLAAGVPARVVRRLTDEEKNALRESARHYVDYARSYRAQSVAGRSV